MEISGVIWSIQHLERVEPVGYKAKSQKVLGKAPKLSICKKRSHTPLQMGSLGGDFHPSNPSVFLLCLLYKVHSVVLLGDLFPFS